ncbi:hypothetical protein B0H10DRAFT_757845 [Mycena sp. CBHHK59/15]|nr:hypothetical protein B0H10DRAFT_757845 [Mycena sp. CBHHK59/15]
MADRSSFPSELEQEIFETAAVAYPKTIPTLLLVCHRVHVWIEPLLYRVLQMDKEPAISGIAAALKSKPAGFFQKAVRHIFLDLSLWRHVHTEANLRILKTLSPIDNLVIMNYSSSDSASHQHLVEKRINRLGLFLTWVLRYPVDLKKPMFSSVTHLLIHNAHDGGGQEWSDLVSLRALTHLCLSQHISSSILPNVLSQCPRLHVVIRMWADRQSAEMFSETLTITDSRLRWRAWEPSTFM